jgi:Protein of unknown function (DUF2281)
MLTTIKGTFENGQIKLKTTPKIKVKTEVIVTFLEVEKIKNPKNKLRRAGGIGKVWMSEDFNEPLEDLKEYT